MSQGFQVVGLDAAEFAPLFAVPPETLASRGMRRVVADSDVGFPCRVSLQDASAGAAQCGIVVPAPHARFGRLPIVNSSVPPARMSSTRR